MDELVTYLQLLDAGVLLLDLGLEGLGAIRLGILLSSSVLVGLLLLSLVPDKRRSRKSHPSLGGSKRC